MAHRLLAIAPEGLSGPEPIKEFRRYDDDGGIELRVVIPAVEATPFRHTMGDVDEPRREAEEKLARTLENLREEGVEASGEVGDPDPVQAAQDALLVAPADEILIFEHDEEQSKWFEEDLMDRAKAGLEPPLRVVVLHDERDGSERVVEVEEAGPGLVDPDADQEVSATYVPGLTRSDLAVIAVGVLGTIATLILAAAVVGKSGNPTGKQAAAILVGIGIALVNLANTVGLTLMESVRYRGGFAKFFKTVALLGTPLAVLVNLVLLVA